MPLTKQEQRAIIDAVDPAFAQLDLSAFPSLQEPPQPSRDDDRFAKDWRDNALSGSATALRAFVSNPDNETLERVGRETGNEDFVDEIRQRRGELVVQQFRQLCPDYIPCQDSFENLVKTLSFNALSHSQQDEDTDDQVNLLIDGGYFTPENLAACFKALSREGLMPVPRGTARNLSSSERLRVSRLAQSGRIDDAIGFYLECALPDEEPTLELINDPAYRDVCDSACWAVWEEIALDYVPTPQREAFLRRHVGGRPITIPLLQSAWAACQKNEEGHSRSELLGQIEHPETQPVTTIDELSDAAVDDLYRGSLRAYAQTFRR